MHVDDEFGLFQLQTRQLRVNRYDQRLGGLASSLAQSCSLGVKGLSRGRGQRLQFREPGLAGVNRRELAIHLRQQVNEIIRLAIVFACKGANRKQPILDTLLLRRIEFGPPDHILHRRLRLVEAVQYDFQRGKDRLQQIGRIRRLARQTTLQRGQIGQSRSRAGNQVFGFLDVAGGLLGFHQVRAPQCEPLFLAFFRRKDFQFLDRALQIIGIPHRLFEFGAMARQARFRLSPGAMGHSNILQDRAVAAKGVKYGTMRRRVDQRPIVVLAVEFNQHFADLAHERHAGGLIVDQHPGATVGRLHAPQHQIAIMAQAVVVKQGENRMVGRKIERRGHLPMLRAGPHPRGIAARAERQGQRIKQDGFARTGFAGQDGEPLREIKRQRIDQDDVADGEMDQHGRRTLPVDQAPVRVLETCESQDPPTSRGARPPVCNRA